MHNTYIKKRRKRKQRKQKRAENTYQIIPSMDLLAVVVVKNLNWQEIILEYFVSEYSNSLQPKLDKEEIEH